LHLVSIASSPRPEVQLAGQGELRPPEPGG
jgi:hypothetical protein